MKHEPHDIADRFIDNALAASTQAQPRAGLEERILANLEAQAKPRRWWIWIPVPVAIAALVLLALYLGRPKPKPTPEIAKQPSVVQPAPKPVQPAPLTVAKKAPRPTVRHQQVVLAKHASPQLPTFPSAEPLTKEEQMLLALAKHHPDEAQRAAQQQEEWRATLDADGQQ